MNNQIVAQIIFFLFSATQFLFPNIADAAEQRSIKVGYVGSIEYTEPNVEDVNTIVLKLKQIKPEVVYIDGQPNGPAKILKKLKEMKIENVTVFTNSIAEDMLKQNLISRENLPKLYFTKRASYSTEFNNKFKSKYNAEPFLNSDLGYYSVLIIAESMRKRSETGKLEIQNNLQIDGLTFKFDANNVFRGISQQIHALN